MQQKIIQYQHVRGIFDKAPALKSTALTSPLLCDRRTRLQRISAYTRRGAPACNNRHLRRSPARSPHPASRRVENRSQQSLLRRIESSPEAIPSPSLLPPANPRFDVLKMQLSRGSRSIMALRYAGVSSDESLSTTMTSKSPAGPSVKILSRHGAVVSRSPLWLTIMMLVSGIRVAGKFLKYIHYHPGSCPGIPSLL